MEVPARTRTAPDASPALPDILCRAGSLDVRLARDSEDVAAAQALRYRVFYEEMSAKPTSEMRALGRDFDAFDKVCDILLVIDHSRPSEDNVVGTYRLLRQRIADRMGGFYSSSEYDLAPLIGKFTDSERGLELGRSCVHPDYRTNATILLLWRAITSYVTAHQIGYMFGCASLPGTDPRAFAPELSFLHHNCLAPPDIRVRALSHLYEPMDLMPAAEINPRRVLQVLPPLIKGYLRLGALIGDGAVVDRQFGTTDVFIILPVSRIGARYFSHFTKADTIQTAAGRA